MAKPSIVASDMHLGLYQSLFRNYHGGVGIGKDLPKRLEVWKHLH
jgi:hypothetical protein